MNFSILRKVSASIMASGLLACAGVPVVNGFDLNSLRTLFWGGATSALGIFGVNSYIEENYGEVKKAAAFGAFTAYEAGSSFITNSKLEKVDELEEQVERLEHALKRTGVKSGNSIQSAALAQNRSMNQQAYAQPMSQVQYYAYGQAPQQVQIMNNMNDGRYNF